MKETAFFIPMTKCQRNLVPTFFTILSLDDGAISVRLTCDGPFKSARIGASDVGIQAKSAQLQSRSDISVFAGSAQHNEKSIQIMFWIQEHSVDCRAWCSFQEDGKKIYLQDHTT